MSALVLAGLVLNLAQPPQPPPAVPIPGAAQTGPPPSFVYVTESDGALHASQMYAVEKIGTKKIEEKTTDGTPVFKDVQYKYVEMYPVMGSLPESSVRIRDLEGTAVSYAEAVKKLKGGAVAIQASGSAGAKIDPKYLKALKEGTLVLEMLPAPPPSSGTPPPPPKPPIAVPAGAPKGPPPGWISVSEFEGSLQLLKSFPVTKTGTKTVEEKTPDGKVVTKQVPFAYTVMEQAMMVAPEATIKITDLDGKAVAYADAVKQVKGGAVALQTVTASGLKTDPIYLKAVKDGTLVIELLTAPGSPPATVAPPMPPQPLQPVSPLATPANAPKGDTPRLAFVAQVEGQFLQVTYTARGPARSSGYFQKWLPLTEPKVNDRVPAIRVTDTDGSAVSYGTAARKLTGGAVVLKARSSEPVDAVYLNALKEGTLVVYDNPTPLPPQRDVQYPIPDGAPKEEAPRLMYVTTGNGRLQNYGYKVAFEGGKEVKFPFRSDIDEGRFKLKDSAGTAVSYADAVKRVGAGAAVVVADVGAKIDPYLKVLNDTTLVFEWDASPRVMPVPVPKK